MGYWGHHPLAGDTPLDAEFFIRKMLGINQMHGARTEFDALYRERLAERLNEVTDAWEKACQEEKPRWDQPTRHDAFVLPFVMARLGVRTDNRALAARLWGMIGDGGAEARGYTLDAEDGPRRFARMLQMYWGEFMAGGEHGVPDDLGLLNTIWANMFGVDGDAGLVNLQ